jgi:hypothetical protein
LGEKEDDLDLLSSLDSQEGRDSPDMMPSLKMLKTDWKESF